MGKKAREILKLDVDELIELLNKALADEWLAFYQYWVGNLVVKGVNAEAVRKELKEHADEEFEHANMLAERIVALGGTPILHPKELLDKAQCAYEQPSDFHVKKILEQNIDAERCAIDVYQKIINVAKDGNDFVTVNMARKILQDEIDHEDELDRKSVV